MMESNRGNVLAYQFEPDIDDDTVDDNNSGTSDEEESENVSVDESVDEGWCKCGNCSEMNSKKENLCCHSLKSLDFLRAGKGKIHIQVWVTG